MAATRRGFTLVEFTVSMAVLTVLISIVAPAIKIARESARALQCKNHLREIGQAIHNFESQNLSLPAGCDAANGNRHAWCTRILPYLDQTAIYLSYDWTRPWNDSTGTVNRTNLAGQH